MKALFVVKYIIYFLPPSWIHLQNGILIGKVLLVWGWKKWFHYGIVIRNMSSWKGLYNILRFEIVAKSSRTIVRTMVDMESERQYRLAFLIGNLKSASHKLSAINLANFISDYHSWKQIKDNTDIIVFFVIAKASHVAYPTFIRASYIELLIEIVFISSHLFIIGHKRI